MSNLINGIASAFEGDAGLFHVSADTWSFQGMTSPISPTQLPPAMSLLGLRPADWKHAGAGPIKKSWKIYKRGRKYQ